MDPLLSGDIPLEQNGPSTDDILLYTTTAVAAFCFICLILVSIKLRKVLIILSVLQNSAMRPVEAFTVPSFVYKSQETTPLPSKYFWENLDITLDHYILAFSIIINYFSYHLADNIYYREL